ncbi:MAG TPA: S16 family serine protease [Actinomycetota bacterium]
MRRAVTLAAWGLLLVAIVAAGWLRLPYYGIGPGPAREIAPLIRFEGLERFDSGGRLVMTTVRWRELTPFTALRAWLDDDWEVVHRDELYPPGLDPATEERVAVAQMDQSQIHAASVVLSRLTPYPREHGDGAMVEGIYPGCSADGELFPGEIVTAIDGEPVGSRADASALIDAARPGEPLDVEVVSGEERRTVDLVRRRCIEGRAGAFVGVGFVDAFPYDVEMEGRDVGGPSAGLMFALGLYDLLTPGDLTAGATVAGTGTLDLEGDVGGIGSIRDKVVAAEHADASLFLVPRENASELDGIDTGDLRVVTVATFDEAIRALIEAGGEDQGEAVPIASVD